ncbi:14232_t:CDS:1, partial [Funneliformis geosporum]
IKLGAEDNLILIQKDFGVHDHHTISNGHVLVYIGGGTLFW